MVEKEIYNSEGLYIKNTANFGEYFNRLTS